MILPRCEQTRSVLLFSLAVSAALWLWLAQQRSGIQEPYAVGIFRHLLLFQDYYAILPFVAILAAATLPRFQRAGAQLAQWCGDHPWTIALSAVAVLAVAAHAVYHAHPLAMDESVPLFQSKVFVGGRLAAQYPSELLDWLIPRGFQNKFLMVGRDTGAVASMYWPGLALLLTPFTALGAPWLLNPLVGGATLLVMHRLGEELFGTKLHAGYVMLFTLASPAVTINALSYYSMAAHLLASAVFVLLLAKPSLRRALWAGGVGSVALVLSNPLPHLFFALPWIAWLASRRERIKLLAGLFTGYLPLCLLLGFGWALYLRGFASPSGVAELATPSGAAQLLLQKARSVLRLPEEGLIVARVAGLGKLWLWAVPALITAALVGAWRLREDRGIWLVLAGSALLTYFGFFVVPYDQGHGWGFRYFHSAWLVLPLFAAAAIPSGDAASRPSSLPGYLAACAMLSLPLMTGYHAFQVERFIARHLTQIPLAREGESRVTIIDPSPGYYAVDLVQNEPVLGSGTLTLVSRGEAADEAMMAVRFPSYKLLHKDSRGSVWGIARP